MFEGLSQKVFELKHILLLYADRYPYMNTILTLIHFLRENVRYVVPVQQRLQRLHWIVCKIQLKGEVAQYGASNRTRSRYIVYLKYSERIQSTNAARLHDINFFLFLL